MSGAIGEGDTSPRVAPGAARPPTAKRTRRYKKPDFVARWLLVTLRLGVAVTAIALISDFAEMNMLNRALGGQAVSFEEATQSDERQVVIGVIEAVVFVFTTGLLIAWTFRLYSNLEPLGAAGLRRGRGWAIGGWFFPIVNFFMPKQILNDTWRASDPALGMNSAGWRDAPIPPVLTAWWIAFLLATGAGQVAAESALGAVELEALRNSAIAFIVADVLMLTQFLLTIRIVKKLTARQQERASAVQGLAPSARPLATDGEGHANASASARP